MVGILEALDDALDDRRHCPRLAADVELAHFHGRWQGHHAVIHNPRSQTYIRLTGAQASFAESLDGARTLDELTLARLDDGGIDPDETVEFVDFLYRGGFLERPWIDAYAALAARLRPTRTRLLDRAWQRLRSQTITFPGAERFIDKMYDRGGRYLFAVPAQVVIGVILVAGIAVFAGESRSGDFALLDVPSAGAAVTLFVLGLVALFVHESGHALAIRRAGRRILGAGFQLYLANPVFFIDSSDMVMASPRERAVNAAAGPYGEAVVASAAALIAAMLGPSTAGEVCFRFAGVTYIFTAMNLIPFLELDGYWLLTDVLDVPDLRPRALSFLRYDLVDHVRARRPLRRGEWGLVVFGVLGTVFTVVAFVAAWIFWWPVLRSFGTGLWGLGLTGRITLVLVVALILGPIVHGFGKLARAIVRWIGDRIGAVRFRLEQSWRVESAELIGALPLVAELTDDELGDLAGRVRRRRYSPGETIVRQGDAAADFYVIRRGQFSVVEEKRDGGESVIAMLGPGATFGELALLEGTPRVATVRAMDAGEAFSVDAGTFQRLLAARLAPPELAPAEWPITQVWTLDPFRKLDLEAVTALSARGTWQRAAPGDEIVRQGEVGDSFFVVASGQLAVTRDGEPVRTLQRGDYFGELALLDDAPRAATVRAVTPCRLFAVPRSAFDAIVRAAFDAGQVTSHPRAETHSAKRSRR